MAVYDNPSNETIKAFDDVLIAINLEQFGSAKIIVNDKQKDVIKIKKLTPDLKYALGDDLLITVNQYILERLPEIERNMCVQESLTGVSFNFETDKITLNQPDVKTYSGFLQKFGYEKYEVMRESIKTLYIAKKEEDAQNDE
jgi:hypothetical protein